MFFSYCLALGSLFLPFLIEKPGHFILAYLHLTNLTLLNDFCYFKKKPPHQKRKCKVTGFNIITNSFIQHIFHQGLLSATREKSMNKTGKKKSLPSYILIATNIFNKVVQIHIPQVLGSHCSL